MVHLQPTLVMVDVGLARKIYTYMYTVYIRYFWQGITKYTNIRPYTVCIVCTVLANPRWMMCTSVGRRVG